MNYDCKCCKFEAVESYEEPCLDCRPDDFGIPSHFVAVNNNGVNHPSHYNHGKYECIDVMVETFGKEVVEHFCLLNAFKYLWRSEHKNGLEDIKKAWWYLDKYLELEGEKRE